MGRFPKMVRMQAAVPNRHVTPRTPGDLKLSGQDLFTNSEQSVKSLEILGKSIINPLLDFSIGDAVPQADLIFTSFQKIPNPNVRIRDKVSQRA